MGAHSKAKGRDASAPEAMQSACGALYRVLETAIGADGLEALIARALQITAREHPWLRTVTAGTTADCPLAGLSEAAEPLDPTESASGCAALLSTLLWLLVTFIGHDLTMRFVRHAWPDVSLKKLIED